MNIVFYALTGFNTVVVGAFVGIAVKGYRAVMKSPFGSMMGKAVKSGQSGKTESGK